MNETSGTFADMLEAVNRRGGVRFSAFLNLSEQHDAEIVMRGNRAEFAFFGGHADCERRMLGVGADKAPDEADFPISCVHVFTRFKKSNHTLSHRDVLGALMGLGIDRSILGDIAAKDDGAYIFCTTRMSEYIISSLNQVGAEYVSCEIVETLQGDLKKKTEVRVQVTSARLDAVIARLFKLSRGDAQELFRQHKISIDDAICEKPDYALSPGQIISARGFGRAKFVDVEGVSKKGKQNLLIELYQ